MTTAQILTQTSLFKPLSDNQLKGIIELSRKKNFEVGEEVFHHGQQADTLYVLLDGSVSLRIEAPEELDVMAETIEQPGSVFGIAALMKSGTYNETARCIQSATVLPFDSAELREIIRQEPLNGLEAMEELAQLYLNRLNNTRAASTVLCRAFRSVIHKSEVYGVYGEMG